MPRLTLRSIDVGGHPLSSADAARGLEALLADVAADKREFIIFDAGNHAFVQATASSASAGALYVEELFPAVKDPAIVSKAMTPADLARFLHERFGEIDLAQFL